MGSHTIHEQYDYRVQPSEFIGLGRGGAAYQHRVDAFLSLFAQLASQDSNELLRSLRLQVKDRGHPTFSLIKRCIQVLSGVDSSDGDQSQRAGQGDGVAAGAGELCVGSAAGKDQEADGQLSAGVV